ncbi:MAG: TonB-dependent receptor [Gammaproteobacteria bacterium]|nr:TonB-dependent receptor [Gammaproteobacteria bacterium]
MNDPRRPMIVLPSVLLACLAATDVAAQATGGDGAQQAEALDEIVVTATRQSVALSKVALSVTAYNQETLDLQGARDVDDIARLTPGVALERSARYNSSQSNITVRGIRSTSGVPTTGIYIDDTPVQIRVGTSQSASNPYPRIFDLERIEVLRGPQGTLFGAGAVGGAVRFITPDASLSARSLYARGEYSFTDNGEASSEAGIAAGGPIIDGTLGYRVSAWRRDDGGWVDRLNYDGSPADDNANRANASVLRLALAWQPTERLRITPSVFYQNTHSSDTSVYVESISRPGSSDLNQNNVLPQPSRDEFALWALKGEYDFGTATLISSTSYLDRRTRNTYDATSLDLASQARVYGPPPVAFQDAYTRGDMANDQQVFTQEIRLQNNDPDARLNWVVGGFYSEQKVHDYYGSVAPFLLEEVNYGRALRGLPPCADLPACFFGVGYYQGVYALYLDGNIKDTQSAAFAQVDFRIADRLKLTVGARYAQYDFKQVQFRAGTVIVSNGATVVLEQSDDPVTPKFGVAFQLDADNLFYANASKGYRIGGAATPVGARCAADAAALGFDPGVIRSIKPDTVWSYELGAKNKVLDGRLQLDTAAYYIDWKDVQSILTLPSCSVPTTLNLGKARSQGVDLAAQLRATDRLVLGVAVGYNDSQYTTTTRGAGGVAIRSAGEPLGVPPLTLYLNGMYEFPVANRDAYVRADFTHTTREDHPLEITSPIVNPDIPRPPATSMLDLRAGLRFDRADVSVFAQNVTNAHPELARYEDTPPANFFRGATFRPRTIGITGSYRF